MTPGYSTEVHSDGWCEWQLHDVAHTFGPVMLNGMEPPFETNIELLLHPPYDTAWPIERDAKSFLDLDNRAVKDLSVAEAARREKIAEEKIRLIVREELRRELGRIANEKK